MDYTKRELWSAFIAIALALFLGSLDMAAIPTALPTIGIALNGNEYITWVMTAYMLAATVTAPIYGKLSDIYGSRRMLGVALVIFILGALLCAVATNIYQLIFFRLLQGLGSGGLMVLSFITVGKIVPAREQGLYQGLLAGVFALASLLGPLMGGVFTQYLSWRGMFVTYVILATITFIMVQRSLKKVVNTNSNNIKIDILGAILLTLWIIDVLFLTKQFNNATFVITPQLIGLGCGALLLLVLFILHELRAAEPLTPLSLFQKPTFAASIIAIFISSISSFAATFFLPQYFQQMLGVSPTISGLLLEPLQIGMIIGPIASGWLVARFISYKTCLLYGIGIVAIMYFLLALPQDVLSIHIAAIPVLLSLGAGLGLIMPLITVAIQNSVAKSNIGSATATLGLARSMGSLMGVVVFSIFYSSNLSKDLIAGAFNILFFVAGILAVVSWIAILFLGKSQPTNN